MFVTRWPPGRRLRSLAPTAVLALLVLAGCQDQPLAPQVQAPVEASTAAVSAEFTPSLQGAWADPLAHSLFQDLGDEDARQWVMDRWERTTSGRLATMRFSLGDDPGTAPEDRILLDALSLILSGASDNEGAPSGPRTDGVR